MHQEIKEIIESLGIYPEDEHYEIAEEIIRRCADFVDPLTKVHMFNHFGITKI
jgi:hypothetical protein